MKYLVILTKSSFVASQLARSFELGKDGIVSTSKGAALSSNGSYDFIPATYIDMGYHFCCVQYDEAADVEPYRLVFA